MVVGILRGAIPPTCTFMIASAAECIVGKNRGDAEVISRNMLSLAANTHITLEGECHGSKAA